MNATEKLNELKLKRAALKQSLLDAKAESSQNYHQFVITGKRTDPLHRAKLLADIDRMTAELHRMDRKISAFEGLRLKLRANTILRHLNALLAEQGLSKLMDEAHARMSATEHEVNNEAATAALLAA